MPGIEGLRRSSIEDRQRISVMQMQKGGILIEGMRGIYTWKNYRDVESSTSLAYLTGNLVLKYQVTYQAREPESVVIVLPIEWTPCSYGGVRPWFHCPDCERRCLFVYAHQSRYTCRRCIGLPYHSQGSTGYDRAADRANRIRGRLGWEDGFMNGLWFRPKGMHRKRFLKLIRQHNHYANLSLSLLPFPVSGFDFDGKNADELAMMFAKLPSFSPD